MFESTENGLFTVCMILMKILNVNVLQISNRRIWQSEDYDDDDEVKEDYSHDDSAITYEEKAWTKPQP